MQPETGRSDDGGDQKLSSANDATRHYHQCTACSRQFPCTMKNIQMAIEMSHPPKEHKETASQVCACLHQGPSALGQPEVFCSVLCERSMNGVAFGSDGEEEEEDYDYEDDAD